MSNINGDLLDEGLQAVMGKDRCQDVTAGKECAAPKVQKKSDADPALIRQPSRAATFPRGEGLETKDAEWVKLNVVSPMAKLKCCAKWAMLFGSVSALLFYWQQAGLLDPKAAVPSLILCALGAGLSIGYHAK